MPEHCSHTSPPIPTLKLLHPLSRLNNSLTPSLFIIHYPKRKYRKAAIFSHSLGFTKVKRALKLEGNSYSDYWCCLCKGNEGDVELDAEIMRFMETSEKPTVFPSKKELIKAGRMDLVEAIKRRGGWYSLGWDAETVEEAVDFDLGEFQRRLEATTESASLREQESDISLSGYEIEDELSSDSGDLKPSELPSSSSLGLSLESGAREDAGIDGILSRLEKQRNSELGFNLGRYGYEKHGTSEDDEHDTRFDPFKDVARADLGTNSGVTPRFDIFNSSSGKISPNIGPETWRTWSNQRAGFQPMEFEAAEISFSRINMESDKEIDFDGMTLTTEIQAEVWNSTEKINRYQVRTRLQQLETELNAALHSLKSQREESVTEEAIRSSSGSRKLSDAWEFQENEFIRAKEKLRSIRAKLAVLEGKMALAIIDAEKIVDEKQKRIDGARKALQLLRSTSVVWPNSASEVLLVGSFDGWTTQRKMEKSRTGIFSVCLMLYPGRYEIKFIVDGTWKLDPLRPIVNNNGHENNLLIVT